MIAVRLARALRRPLPYAIAAAAIAAGGCRGTPPNVLTVLAASSLADALALAGKEFERAEPGARLRVAVAGSQQLVAWLASGARGDVLATADQLTMGNALARGLALRPVRPFAGNRLVVIVPAGNPGPITRAADLARRGVRVMIASREVPAGRYARELLARIEASGAVGADYAARVLANVVSEPDNVRQVATAVELGEADAGVVYASDVRGPAARRVRLIALPPAIGVVTQYEIAVTAVARHPALARRFIDFLASPAGARALVAAGLLVMDSTADSTAAARAGER